VKTVALKGLPLSTPSTQSLDRRLTVHQFATLRLPEAGSNFGSHLFALLRQPSLAAELFTYHFEPLIQHLVGVMIGAGLNGEFDHLLMFRFQFDGHDRVSLGCSSVSRPTRFPFTGQP